MLYIVSSLTLRSLRFWHFKMNWLLKKFPAFSEMILNGVLTVGVKGARFYFSKFCFVFHLKDHHHTEDVNLNFQLAWSNCLDVLSNFVYGIAVAYIIYYVNFIMVTITSHFFINIFQMYHLSAVKLYMPYEKNMSFLVMPKSPKLRKTS